MNSSPLASPWWPKNGKGAVLGAVVLAGVALRLHFMAAHPVWLDEGVVGVMGRDIALHGARPISQYWTEWGGTLQAYVVAGFFSFLGESIFTLRLATVPFFLLYLWALVRMARAVG